MKASLYRAFRINVDRAQFSLECDHSRRRKHHRRINRFDDERLRGQAIIRSTQLEEPTLTVSSLCTSGQSRSLPGLAIKVIEGDSAPTQVRRAPAAETVNAYVHE